MCIVRVKNLKILKLVFCFRFFGSKLQCTFVQYTQYSPQYNVHMH